MAPSAKRDDVHGWIAEADNAGEEALRSLADAISDDNWPDVYEAMQQHALQTSRRRGLSQLLMLSFPRLTSDLHRSDAIILLTWLATSSTQIERVDLYAFVRSVEATASSFLRSRVIQAEGLFAHILEDHVIVAGNLVARPVERDAGCAVAHIRALRRAFLVTPDASLERAISRYDLFDDFGVRSEALVQIASIRLIRSLGADSREVFAQHMRDVSLYATGALSYEERQDAILLADVANACSALASLPIDRARFEAARRMLLQRWRESYTDEDIADEPGELAAAARLAEAVERLASALRDVDAVPRALDVAPLLLSITEAAVFLDEVGAAAQARPDGINEIAAVVFARQGFHDYVDKHVRLQLWSSLQHSRAKIIALLARLDKTKDIQQTAYLQSVLDTFTKLETREASPHDPSILIALARAMPMRTPEEVATIVSEQTERGTLLQYFAEIMDQALRAEPGAHGFGEIWGGYPKAREILLAVEHALRAADPPLLPAHIGRFVGVIAYVLRYIIAVSERRIRASFVLSRSNGGKGENATEEDLEVSLFNFLMSSDIAYAVFRQHNLSTGRADLVIRIGDEVYPIEVKREHNDLSREHLKRSFLAQVAAYARSHQRLAISLILDLTDKPKGEPLPDLQDLVFVSEVKAATSKLDVHVPDYVVTLIVPGNLPVPSDLSTYSRPARR